jgi:hypothetical protein
MTFFDKKTEVMKIELTPHGKYLLSIGKLKPHSYKFFDENVIYDSKAMGVTEKQNDTHKRIIDETPLLKCNPNVTGVETNIRKFTSKSVAIKHTRQIVSDDHMSTNNEAIGSCAHDTKNNSAMALDIFGGNLLESGISTSYTSQHIDNAPIPQIPINMYISSSAYQTISAVADAGDEGVVEFTDGTGFILDIQQPIIRLREFNGFDEKDNFTISAYKILSESSGITYHRLKMDQNVSPISGDLLIEDLQDNSILDEVASLMGSEDTEELSFYINIEVDREIPDEEICRKVKDFEIENIFLDDEIICPDTMDDDIYNIYDSLVRPEDLEDCD